MASFATVSDLHGNFHLKAPVEADCFLFGGDLFKKKRPSRKEQLIDQYFDLGDALDYLRSLPAEKVVLIAGNHDYLFESLGYEATNYVLNSFNKTSQDDFPEIIYLENNSVELFSKKIFGTPYSAFHPGNKWPKTHAFVLDGEDYINKIDLPKADIIISHNSPEYVEPADNPDASRHLLEEVKRVEPEIFISGHFHWMRGEYSIGETRAFVPAACQHYQKDKPPYTAIDGSPYFYFDL